MRTSVASNIKAGTCLAVPLHEAVMPPLDRPVRLKSRSSTSPNAPGPGECRVAKRVALNYSPPVRQWPVYDIMVSSPLNLPSGRAPRRSTFRKRGSEPHRIFALSEHLKPSGPTLPR
jgi:hypothetical protein